jgi:hypothetical protein
MNTTSHLTIESKPIASLDTFCEEAGIKPVTALGWRRSGWLVTANIAGWQYLTGESQPVALSK